jgi:hypothetical protein
VRRGRSPTRVCARLVTQGEASRPPTTRHPRGEINFPVVSVPRRIHPRRTSALAEHAHRASAVTAATCLRRRIPSNTGRLRQPLEITVCAGLPLTRRGARIVVLVRRDSRCAASHFEREPACSQRADERAAVDDYGPRVEGDGEVQHAGGSVGQDSGRGCLCCVCRDAADCAVIGPARRVIS